MTEQQFYPQETYEWVLRELRRAIVMYKHLNLSTHDGIDAILGSIEGLTADWKAMQKKNI